MAKINQVVEKVKKIKNIELIIALILCVIVVIVFATTIFSNSQSDGEGVSSTFGEYNAKLQNKLEEVIGDIEGVKSASAVINYQSGVETVYAYDTIVDANGKTTTELVFSQGNPLIVKEIAPLIQGVVIVVKGTSSAVVKIHIKQIVTTLLDIDSSRIEVFAYSN